MAGASRWVPVALALVTLMAAAACAAGSPEGAASGGAAASDSGTAAEGARRRPVVEVPPVDGSIAFLDPGAEPTTALGRLRAQHLPVWTSEFDWAFPPEACGTAWELDGIAEPAAAAETAVLDDLPTAAALAVMRYEYQLSRALADPTPLSQLCVATATVDDARTDALGVLESYINAGARRAEPAAYAEEVWVVGLSHSSAVSVACVTPGYPAVVANNGEVLEASLAPVRLQAYLLTISLGLEDDVADISYRVSDASQRSAESCQGLNDWAVEWDDHVQSWIAAGQVWESLGAIITASQICDAPPALGPDECPPDRPK